MDPARLLEGLDPAQAVAVSSPAPLLCIVAPAGSGKTRVLTRRIARRVLDGSADARHVLALTFTRRAAGELHGRLGALGLRDRPTAGTFHGVAARLLNTRWDDRHERPPELLPHRVRLVSELVGTSRAGEVAAEIDWARARLVPPDRYDVEARRAGRRPAAGLDAVADAYGRYEAAKRSRHLVDFDDLLTLCRRELERDPAWAEAVRWRFRHLFVDEYQDVNPLQQALLEAWRGGRPDLCVVGDPNQAIYGWNGADAAWLTRFTEHHPGAVVVRLGHSYRSSPQILAAAHAVLAAGRQAAEAPSATCPDGRFPEVRSFADERAEAAGIAAWLRSERGTGGRWSSCAVLVRTNAQLGPLEAGLRAAGLPCRVRAAAGLLDEPAVRSRLRRAPEPYRPGSLRDLLDELETELGRPTDPPLPPEGFDDDADELDRPEPPRAEPPSPLATLVSLGWELLADEPDASVERLRTWLASGGVGDDASSADAVTLLTFHAAKGLEWPVVVVAGLETGLVPHAGAVTPEARAEEVRLLYVALTRAERALLCTWARRRGQARRDRSPSPLLAAVEAASRPEPASAPPPDLVARATPPAAAGDPTLAALRAWRRATARVAGLPDRAVCSDSALAAVARARPSTVEELAALPEVGPLAARRLGPRLLEALASARPGA